MEESASTKALDKALLKALSEIQNPLKDSVNPHYKSRYSNLESVLEVCKKPLLASGIVLSQGAVFADSGWFLVTKLKHAESGEFRDTHFPMNPTKNDPQGLASAQTYARRYGLMAMLGLVGEDDDGNKASMVGQQPPAKSKQQSEVRQAPVAQSVPEGEGKKISQPQIARLLAIGAKSGWDAAAIHALVEQRLGVKSLKEVDWRVYDKLVAHVQTTPYANDET